MELGDQGTRRSKMRDTFLTSASWDNRPAPMLENQPNFRDLGGSRSTNGSLVASGEVYRSGELSALTDADLHRLEDLGISTVVDLRSETETALHPNRLPTSVTYRPFPIVPGSRDSAAERFFQTFDPADFPPFEDVYRNLVREHAAEYRALIELVADPDARPLVFHCTAGKDRTGVAAALLLSLLGVAWRDVEEDFLRSNAILQDQEPEIMDRWTRGWEDTGRRLDRDTRRQFERLLGVESSYLAAARHEMIVLGGSVDTYLAEYLGIEDDARETLRQQLLQ